MKDKTTATQGYYQCKSQVRNFMKKEIGSDKDFQKYMLKWKAELEKIKQNEEKNKKVDQKSRDALDNKVAAMKPYHHKYYSALNTYGKMMDVLVEKNKKVNQKIVSRLLHNLEGIRGKNVFSMTNLEWSSEAGVKAMKKFTDILLENDHKKFQYYHECLRLGNANRKGAKKSILLEDVLSCPLPKLEEPGNEAKEKLLNTVNALSERLNHANSKAHIDSSEFRNMKTALNSLKEDLTTKELTSEEIGSHVEALQAASMKYVKAKGVGRQSSDFGKERMDIALDICSMAVENMNFYASKERIDEIRQFELNNFDKVISAKGVFDFQISDEKFASMDLSEKEIDDELEDEIEELEELGL